MSVKTLRDIEGTITGYELHNPEYLESFSTALLDQLEPALGTWDRDTGLVTLTGVNRTVVYQLDVPADGWHVSAHLISDEPTQ